MRRTQDYNDSVVHSGNTEVTMNLFYMCAKRDNDSYDPEARCGLFMSGKLWDRRGAAPEQTKAWYCGLERSDWDALVQRTYLIEAGAPNNLRTIDLDKAMNEVQREIGCKCRFKPCSEGASMVFEVSDKSQPGTLVQYAIRASIPPGPLSAEIKKVQRGWYKAGK